MNPILKKMGFEDADSLKVSPRIILSLSALEKQGKSHFALTAPGPIAYFNMDFGTEGVIGKFAKEKAIYIKDIARMTEDNNIEDVQKEWEDLKKSYKLALTDSGIRSIVLDTATEIWELLRLARFGRLTQVMPFQYGIVNAEYRALIREAYNHDKNLILLHKMKDKYVNDKNTGEFERAGFKDTGFLVQVNAEIYRDEDGVFCFYIRDCRHDADLAGEEFEGDMCEFPVIAEMIAPGAGS